MRARPTSTVLEDCRREIVSLGVDARGPYAILACGHKFRRNKYRNYRDGQTPPAAVAGVTHRWCKSCENRSPHTR